MGDQHLYVADTGNHRVVRVSLRDGTSQVVEVVDAR